MWSVRRWMPRMGCSLRLLAAPPAPQRHGHQRRRQKAFRGLVGTLRRRLVDFASRLAALLGQTWAIVSLTAANHLITVSASLTTTFRRRRLRHPWITGLLRGSLGTCVLLLHLRTRSPLLHYAYRGGPRPQTSNSGGFTKLTLHARRSAIRCRSHPKAELQLHFILHARLGSL